MPGIEYGYNDADRQGAQGATQPGAMFGNLSELVRSIAKDGQVPLGRPPTPGIGPGSPQDIGGAKAGPAPGTVPPTVLPAFNSLLDNGRENARPPGLAFAALAHPDNAQPAASKPGKDKTLTEPNRPDGGG